MPGTARKFMPKYGSLYTPFSTRTAKTVFGAEVLYQLDASKPVVDRVSALALTFAEDCTVHPSRKVISPSAREAGAAIVAAAETSAAIPTATSKLLFSPTIRAIDRKRKFFFLPFETIRVSPATPGKPRHLNRFNGANNLQFLGWC